MLKLGISECRCVPLLELASQPVALKSFSLSLPLLGEESARAGGTGIRAALPGSSHLPAVVCGLRGRRRRW